MRSNDHAVEKFNRKPDLTHDGGQIMPGNLVIYGVLLPEHAEVRTIHCVDPTRLLSTGKANECITPILFLASNRFLPP